MKPIANLLGLCIALFFSLDMTAQNCGSIYPSNSVEGYVFKLVYVDNDCSDPDNPMSTWFYCVTSGGSKALSHFVFQFCDLSNITASSILDAGTWTGTPPNANLGQANTEFTTNGDPQTGAVGLKFDDGFNKGETRGVYFKLDGIFDIGSGNTEGVDIGIKAGNLAETYPGVVEGPCLPTAGPCGQIFPIDLVLFEADREGQEVMVKWAGHATPEFDHFEVQHSMDGHDFQSIGFVARLGSIEVQEHSFVHNQPLPGNNFYRLKMVDVDGSFSYSPVHYVLLEQEVDEVSVFPNPVNKILTINLPPGYKTITLHNLRGETIREHKISNQFPQVEMNVETLPNGVFYLQSVNTKGEFQRKLVVKH